MTQLSAAKCNDSSKILERLDKLIAARYPQHPFETGIHTANFEAVMNEYIAMSVAFPYVQAGAVFENYRRCADTGGMPDDNAAITAAVGTFLAWDEFGGHHLVLRHGAEGLLKLTDVDRHFHSALLRRDIGSIRAAKLPSPQPAQLTRNYLAHLYEGLSCSRGNRNVAHMVAFERHAMAMITALWDGLKTLFGVQEMERFSYFHAHIGLNNAGEAIHVEMTESMIARLVPENEASAFLEYCVEAYGLNFRWCQDVLDYANSRSGSAVVASAS